MKDQLMLFGVTLAKRCTRSQKRIFYSQIIPYFKKFGYAVEFQESEGRLNHVSNILIGDIHKARRIVLCPYDTPTRSFFSYKYYPFNWDKNLKQEYLELVLSFLIYATIGSIIFYLLGSIAILNPYLKTLGAVLLVILVFFGFSPTGGIPNPVNFNKNSASLALLASIAEKMARNSETCFVLLDKNATSSAGLKLLAQDETLKDKTFIYLDSLAYGDKVACVYSPDAESEAKNIQTRLNSLNPLDKLIDEERGKDTYLQFFPKMIHLCIGTIEKQVFFVQNTRSKKDYQVDLPRLEIILDGLFGYLRG